MSVPFRWDIRRAEQLGTLVEGPAMLPYPTFVDDLRRCLARVLACCDDGRLVFVGRSPESLYDYLSGLLEGTSWADRLTLLNVSLRDLELKRLKNAHPEALCALREHLAVHGLAPWQIASSPRPLILVDLVWTGSTFERLLAVLLDWAHDTSVAELALLSRLRLRGLTIQERTSPKTWRWQQHAPWARKLRPAAIKNVSLCYWLWTYLGDSQPKVARGNPPEEWGAAEQLRPPRFESTPEALRLARTLYTLGRTREHRALFARGLAVQPGMRQPWLRSLVLELRGQRERS